MRERTELGFLWNVVFHSSVNARRPSGPKARRGGARKRGAQGPQGPQKPGGSPPAGNACWRGAPEGQKRRRPTLPPCGSTIGAAGLNCPVRDGKGWDPRAVATSMGWQAGKTKHLAGGARAATPPSGRQRTEKRTGPLVPLGCTSPLCTCGLSTSSSRTALMRKPHLGAGFALRCLQRLSQPDVATGRCPWRDNPRTSGPSGTVLSY